jgi:hypothetical protein
MASTQPEKRTIRSRIREVPARFIARTPWLRRRYARRLLKSIDKMQQKRRPLPDNLRRLEHMLRRVPKPQHQQLVEQMMEVGTDKNATTNRSMRRAHGRQDRRKGQPGGGLRPGTLPGQRQRPRN